MERSSCILWGGNFVCALCAVQSNNLKRINNKELKTLKNLYKKVSFPAMGNDSRVTVPGQYTEAITSFTISCH